MNQSPGHPSNAGGEPWAPRQASGKAWRSAPPPKRAPAGNAPPKLSTFDLPQGDRFPVRSARRRGTPSTTWFLARRLSVLLRGMALAHPISRGRTPPASCNLARPYSPQSILREPTPPACVPFFLRLSCPPASGLFPRGSWSRARRLWPVLRRRSGRSDWIRNFLHVHLLSVAQRVRRIQHDPVIGLQPVQHFQRNSVVAADGQRLQPCFVARIHHHRPQPLRAEEQRIYRHLKPIALNLHFQMHLSVSARKQLPRRIRHIHFRQQSARRKIDGI